jgi:cytochrome c oxidase cbb3-type subunit 4
MSSHSTYDALRHLADSWGLLVMFVMFGILIAWPFRPSVRSCNEEAANSIFKDDDDGE